ncbi:phage tail tube protein FII [Trichonephila clavata]|uniref:Phage tail tube protein FII n=1 Tax=Trichonephila clavata TaxID=2740835 RepID=A0A8X6HD86_TRICU|nr:phage tail tube protein FII [Trichonephila clavata]
MLPKILKNFNVFVDGRGYAGKIDEVTLPKLTIKTEEYRAGGMDIPINIDMGMEKLEAEFTFAEYDSELFRLFGLIDGNSVSLTLRADYKAVEENFMQTITLNNPITVDGISVSELTVRRPKVRDYLAIERLNGSDLSKEVTLTANLTSVAKEVIEELDIADYVKVQEVLKDFFSPIIQKT